jgi:hypothetical protein
MLIVVDDLSARPGRMTSFRLAAQKMLSTLDLGDLVGVATTSGLGPIVMPTRDRAAVRAALDSTELVGRFVDTATPFYVSIPEALEINQVASHVLAHEGQQISLGTSTFARVVTRECFKLPVGRGGGKGGQTERIDDTCDVRVTRAAVGFASALIRRAEQQLNAYVQLINALGAAPSPRVMIALSAGLATGADMNFSDVDPVGLAAAKSGVQFYALTDTAEDIDVADFGEDRAAARRQEEAYLVSGVQTLASAAGGEAFKVVGQPERFFNRIVSETSGLYQLGVEATSLPAKSEFVSVKVSVHRPGVTARTKAHALVPSALASLVPVDEQLRARIAQGGAAFGVPMSLARVLRRDPAPGAKLQLAVFAQVPADVSGPLTAMFALVDAEGRITQQGRKELRPAAGPAGYQLAVPMTVDDGVYRVRLAIADGLGHVGSVEQTVTAKLAHWGTCTVSDLFATASEGAGAPRLLSGGELPGGATTLNATLELYPDTGANAADFSVRMELLQVDGQSSVQQHTSVPAGTGSSRTASASMAVDQLKPGRYTLRATLLERGVEIGHASIELLKK